ncbi:phage tail protein [Zooshikella sp. RANM57]|uniref:phage tail protein n=1 Tax=Zooshikella sp. RANM57 TaxID=3425863 RepID=UPI003D6E24C3
MRVSNSSSIDFSVEADTTLIKMTLNKFEISEAAFNRAANRAVNKTARWFRYHVLKEVSANIGISQKILKERFKLSLISPKSNKKYASFWSGLLGVDPIKIGKGRKTKKGYKVGKYSFDGVFKAYQAGRWEDWKTGVYERVSDNRLPIKRYFMPIEDRVKPIIERIYGRAQAQIFKKLRQELNYESIKSKGK